MNRRLYGRVVLGLLIAGAIALFAVTRAWASTTVRTSGLPTDHVQATGAEAAPILAGLAVVVVAGALAVVASGGWLRQVVGLLIAAVAGFAAVRALMVDAAGAPLRRALRDSPSFLASTRPEVAQSPWPWVAALAFAVAAVLGVVVVARGRRWPRMSARYERRPESPADEDVDLWRALDDGTDPTA